MCFLMPNKSPSSTAQLPILSAPVAIFKIATLFLVELKIFLAFSSLTGRENESDQNS